MYFLGLFYPCIGLTLSSTGTHKINKEGFNKICQKSGVHNTNGVRHNDSCSQEIGARYHTRATLARSSDELNKDFELEGRPNSSKNVSR